jgi:hypothetical protein
VLRVRVRLRGTGHGALRIAYCVLRHRHRHRTSSIIARARAQQPQPQPQRTARDSNTRRAGQLGRFLWHRRKKTGPVLEGSRGTRTPSIASSTPTPVTTRPY